MNRDELKQRAFQLAGYIHSDRQLSISIVVDALRNLETDARKQRNRLSKLAKFRRNKVKLGYAHIVQLNVMWESEQVEILQELPHTEAQLTLDDMVKRYVKFLVAETVDRNAVWVLVGLNLLYYYSPKEIADIQIALTEGERVTDDSNFRTLRSKLIKQLSTRFRVCFESEIEPTPYLEMVVVRGPFDSSSTRGRGQTRPRAESASPRHTDLVRESFDHFLPWDVGCVLFTLFEKHKIVSRLSKRAKDILDSKTEKYRIHTLLHPSCFERLSREYEIVEPYKRLRIPMFVVEKNLPTNLSVPGDSHALLDQSELKGIESRIAETSFLRQTIKGGTLRFFADGIFVGELPLSVEGCLNFLIAGNTRILKVFWKGPEKQLQVATCMLRHQPISNFKIWLRHGRQLIFTVDSLEDASAEAEFHVTIELEHVSSLSVVVDPLLNILPRTVLAQAACLVFAILIFLVAMSTWRSHGLWTQSAQFGEGSAMDVNLFRERAQEQPIAGPLGVNKNSTRGTPMNGKRIQIVTKRLVPVSLPGEASSVAAELKRQYPDEQANLLRLKKLIPAVYSDDQPINLSKELTFKQTPENGPDL